MKNNRNLIFNIKKVGQSVILTSYKVSLLRAKQHWLTLLANTETQRLRGVSTHCYTEFILQELQSWSKSIKVRI